MCTNKEQVYSLYHASLSMLACAVFLMTPLPYLFNLFLIRNCHFPCVFVCVYICVVEDEWLPLFLFTERQKHLSDSSLRSRRRNSRTQPPKYASVLVTLLWVYWWVAKTCSTLPQALRYHHTTSTRDVFRPCPWCAGYASWPEWTNLLCLSSGVWVLVCCSRWSACMWNVSRRNSYTSNQQAILQMLDM